MKRRGRVSTAPVCSNQVGDGSWPFRPPPRCGGRPTPLLLPHGRLGIDDFEERIRIGSCTAFRLAVGIPDFCPEAPGGSSHIECYVWLSLWCWSGGVADKGRGQGWLEWGWTNPRMWGSTSRVSRRAKRNSPQRDSIPACNRFRLGPTCSFPSTRCPVSQIQRHDLEGAWRI